MRNAELARKRCTGMRKTSDDRLPMTEPQDTAEDPLSRITALIPHRPPFLFVDEIVSLDESTIEAFKTVDPDEEFFKGHYPDFPIMPGVLVCECLFQSAALLLSSIVSDPGARAPVLTRVGKAKFRRIVLPGDRIDLRVTLDQRVSDVFYMKGKASVGGEMAVTIDFSCALVDKETLLAKARG
jgi:3-hydroxyacyl-[acyl-carrier-protein] dehydratase